MKKFFIGIAIVAACAASAFAAEDGRNYASTGIVEISGMAGFSGTRVFSSNDLVGDYGIINFNLRPQVDFFIINGFHMGLAPNLGINTNIFDNGTVSRVTIGPVVSGGYCFRLTDTLFLDLAPAVGFHYTTWIDSGDRVSSGVDEMFVSFEMFTTLKIAVGHALVNIGLFQAFEYFTWDNPDGYDYFTMGVTVGFSVFF